MEALTLAPTNPPACKRMHAARARCKRMHAARARYGMAISRCMWLRTCRAAHAVPCVPKPCTLRLCKTPQVMATLADCVRRKGGQLPDGWGVKLTLRADGGVVKTFVSPEGDKFRGLTAVVRHLGLVAGARGAGARDRGDGARRRRRVSVLCCSVLVACAWALPAMRGFL